jgi:hypothetical protein
MHLISIRTGQKGAREIHLEGYPAQARLSPKEALPRSYIAIAIEIDSESGPRSMTKHPGSISMQ